MDSKTILYTIPIFIVLLAIHLLPDSQATNQPALKYNILAIEYSEGCEKLLQYTQNSTCPGLEKLVKYDTSNQYVSGKFIKIDGKLIRQNPQVKNNYEYYSHYTKTMVCVDCTLDLGRPDIIKTIFIEPNEFTFIDKSENMTKNRFNSYSNRYTTPDCLTSTISYSDKLLNDTISYMLSNCTKTSIQTNQTNTIKETPFSFDNPFSSLLYKNQIHQLKKDGMQNCIIKKCDIPNIYKKKGW